MKEIVERLTENRNIERAKIILESAGYDVSEDGSSILDRVAEYGTDGSEILDHPEEYFPRDCYNEDDVYPPDAIKRAIEEYMKKSPSQVLIIDGEGDLAYEAYELYNELRDEYKEVRKGETFYQGMGTGEGINYGTVEGENVLFWWVGGANPSFVIPRR